MSEVNGGLRTKVIGKQIRKYRNEKGYTQEQLGKLLGVSTQAVSNMYSRMNTPVTTAVISSKTDIPEEELEDCMETLYARRRNKRL